jgi:alpha-tubulin suppressor-like RCC1 family protein
VTLPTAARAVEVGHSHACARLEGGAMRCWGSNFFGQLGVTDASAAEGPHEPVGVSAVTRIALGSGHSCALQQDGEVWCWGDHRPDRRYDQTIAPPGRRGEEIRTVVAGGPHTCLFSTDGSTHCQEVFQERVWPNGARGRAHQAAVILPDGTVEVALGEGHRCVRLTDTIRCWGNNGSGQSAPTEIAEYLGESTPVVIPR